MATSEQEIDFDPPIFLKKRQYHKEMALVHWLANRSILKQKHFSYNVNSSLENSSKATF